MTLNIAELPAAQQISELGEQFKQQRAAYQTAVKEQIFEVFRHFIENTEFVRIQWSQYTPYFNDGDTCEFNKHENEYFLANPVLFGEDEDAHDDETEFYGYGVPDDDPRKVAMEALETFLDEIEESTWYDIFGDHVQVIITSEGIEVEEYDHD